jgi:hypothetical protein
MPGQTRVAGGLIKGRLSEKNVLHPFPRWRRRQVITLLLAGKEASLKYTQAWERMGSLHFIGASIMHGSTYNPIKPKLLNII